MVKHSTKYMCASDRIKIKNAKEDLKACMARSKQYFKEHPQR